MSKLKIVGGTKDKKEIDPKHYASAENLINIVFAAYDLIWVDAINNVEKKINGESTFLDSFIGTTSMNEVIVDLDKFLKDRKNIIEKLVNTGTLEEERKFIIFPKYDEDASNGLTLLFKVHFTFDQQKEIFSFNSDMSLNLNDDAKEKYKLVKDEILNIIESIKGKDIKALSVYVNERAKYYNENTVVN